MFVRYILFITYFFISSISNAQSLDSIWNIQIEDEQGKTRKLSDFKGKVIYVDVWASWCLPCRWEFPKFEYLADEYKNKNIIFLSLSVDESKEKWLKFLQRKKHHLEEFRVTDSDEKRFSDYFEIYALPHFILIDSKGNLYQNNTLRPSDIGIDNLLTKVLSQ